MRNAFAALAALLTTAILASPTATGEGSGMAPILATSAPAVLA